jgi:LPS sulfotransferase NodH
MPTQPLFGYHFRRAVAPFVILFIERDGSTYLTSLLESRPDIRVVYERLAVMRQKGQGAHEQLEWAGRFLTPPAMGRAAAIGFKTKLVDVLDPQGFAGLLQARRCRILQMRRRNHVKAVVSRINARRLYERSGHWNLYRDQDRLPALEIDPAEFGRFLFEREESERELGEYVGRLALPTLEIVYEDLLQARRTTLAQVFEFLGVPVADAEGKTLKHTPDDLRQVILNFDELRASYAGTRYAPMFDEHIPASR